MTPRGASAVALVESPAQLLNAVEWAWAEAVADRGGHAKPSGRFGRGVGIDVLAPMDPTGRLQLHRLTEMARSHGFEVTWHEVRGGVLARLRGLVTAVAAVSRADTVVVGDPFSGVIQFLIGLTGPKQIVVVDDGSATLEFVEIVHGGRELIRWHSGRATAPPARLLAALARRRLRTGRAHDAVRLFTSMPVTSSMIGVDRNELAWIRARFAPPRVVPGVADLVGTSLVESGIVDEEHYLRAVGMLARDHHATRYLAHRRESAAKLTRIESLGLEIVRPELPLEIVARTGPTAAQIISFPSTVVHTLPLALSDTEIEVVLCEIEREWFNPGHLGSRAATFLSSVVDAARTTYGLNAVKPD